MEKIIEKISSYNLFNYLLPGVLFSIFAKDFITLDLIQGNLILDVFLYYFIGLVVSRTGSLIVEPLLKRFRFARFSKYEDFVSASNTDIKIEILSEACNMYRTFVAMFFLLFITKFYFYIQATYPWLQEWNMHILISSLLLMFLYSYRKQAQYIFNRVNIIKK